MPLIKFEEPPTFKKYCIVDKAEWPDGPWKHEPDLAKWRDKNTGYSCIMHRKSTGFLCGYVGVDKNHSLWKQSYDGMNFTCHGGVTFADWMIESVDTELSMSKSLWFIGFDCAHCSDLIPAPGSQFRLGDEEYRRWDYVENEVSKLAGQIKEYQASFH